MSGTYQDRLDALEQCWGRWAEVGASLSESDWIRPTRCPGWDVRALFAHVAGYPMALRTRPEAPPTGELVGAVDLLRGYNAPDTDQVEAMAEAVAEGARGQAAALGPERLVAAFAEDAPAAIGRLRREPGDTIVPWPTGGSIKIIEALRIAVLEATVHLYDLQHALDLDRRAPTAAEAETVRLLAEVPTATAFIEAATGRGDEPILPVIR